MSNPFHRKPKRIRTAFTPGQLLQLEKEFTKNHYVVGAERKQLARSLKLTETQVNNFGVFHLFLNNFLLQRKVIVVNNYYEY